MLSLSSASNSVNTQSIVFFVVVFSPVSIITDFTGARWGRSIMDPFHHGEVCSTEGKWLAWWDPPWQAGLEAGPLCLLQPPSQAQATPPLVWLSTLANPPGNQLETFWKALCAVHPVTWVPLARVLSTPPPNGPTHPGDFLLSLLDGFLVFWVAFLGLP